MLHACASLIIGIFGCFFHADSHYYIYFFIIYILVFFYLGIVKSTMVEHNTLFIYFTLMRTQRDIRWLAKIYYILL